MSTAAAFVSIGSFPFCPADPSGALYDTVDGLTLAEAMDFFWNVEDVEFTFTGSSTGPSPHAQTASINGSIKFKPPTASGDFTNPQDWSFLGCGMLFSAIGVPLASLPAATKEPVERVCPDSGYSLVFGANNEVDFYKLRIIQLTDFAVRNDPVTPGLYCIHYRFRFAAGDFNNYALTFCNPSASAGSSSGSYVSGTFTINSLTFGWRCYYNDNVTGASMSASTTKFTY